MSFVHQESQLDELEATLRSLHLSLQSIDDELDWIANFESRKLLVWKDSLQLGLSHQVLNSLDFEVTVLKTVDLCGEQ